MFFSYTFFEIIGIMKHIFVIIDHMSALFIHRLLLFL